MRVHRELAVLSPPDDPDVPHAVDGELPKEADLDLTHLTPGKSTSGGNNAARRPAAPERYGVPAREFLGEEEPSNDPSEIFDVHGIIVRGEPGLIIGAPKVGKTLLVEDLLLHVAAGRKEWCGIPIYRRCRVLLFLREDSERTSRRRLWQLARGAGIEHWELADHLVIDVKSPLYFDDKEHIRKLTPQLRDFEICTIDSLSTIHNADENSVERMAPVMNAWRDLALTTATGMPLIHHFRKEGNGGNGQGGRGQGILQRARGSSLIGATTRHAVGVDSGPERDQVVLSCESNHEIDTDPFVIRRVFGATGKLGRDGREERFIRHERVGSMQAARDASEATMLDPITRDVIRRAGFQGIGSRNLRERVNERLQEKRGRGVRPIKIDESADRLQAAGEIESHEGRWRMVGTRPEACPEG